MFTVLSVFTVLPVFTVLSMFTVFTVRTIRTFQIYETISQVSICSCRLFRSFHPGLASSLIYATSVLYRLTTPISLENWGRCYNEHS
jgi:hypothetical protein